MQHPDPLLKLTRLAFIAALALLIMSGVAWRIMGHMARSTQTTVQPTDSAANEATGGFPMSGDFAPDFTLTVTSSVSPSRFLPCVVTRSFWLSSTHDVRTFAH